MVSFGRRRDGDSHAAVHLLCREKAAALNGEQRARLTHAAGADIGVNDRRACEGVVIVEEALDRFDRKRNERNAMLCRECKQCGFAGFRRNRCNLLHLLEGAAAQCRSHSGFDLVDGDSAPAADAERERSSRRGGRKMLHVGLGAGARRLTFAMLVERHALARRPSKRSWKNAQAAARP